MNKTLNMATGAGGGMQRPPEAPAKKKPAPVQDKSKKKK